MVAKITIELDGDAMDILDSSGKVVGRLEIDTGNGARQVGR